LPLGEKVGKMIPFLQRAGLVGSQVSAEEEAKVAQIVTALGDRVKVFGDVVLQAKFFFGDEVVFDEKAFAKRVLAPGALGRLQIYRDWLAQRTAFDAATLEKETHDLVTAQGWGLGDIVHAVRVAITGTAVGPGLFDCLAILGQSAVL